MKKRSDVPRKFFSSEERDRIVAAIGEAELQTSGEIRFHVERDVPTGPPSEGDTYQRAREVFGELGMHATEARNGVLVYMAVRARKFAVVGDEELHKKVGDGIAQGIGLIGEKLREHFPYQSDDVNELSDDISFS